MPAIEVPTPEQAAAYADKLNRVVSMFQRLGYGSRQRASFDLRIAPSRISGVLNFRSPEPETLAALEGWAAEQLKAEGTP